MLMPKPRTFLGDSRSWLLWGKESVSSYDGWYVPSGPFPAPYQKLLHRIESFQGTALNYQFPRPGTLRVTSADPTDLHLYFDPRLQHAPDCDGRSFSVEHTQHGARIHYKGPDTQLEIHLSGTGDIGRGRWRSVATPLDVARGTGPGERWCWVLDVFEVTNLSIEVAPTLSWEAPQSRLTSYNSPIARAARATLEALATPQGYLAGFPWFHQAWTRDELIAALGLEPDEREALIQRYASLELKEGEWPTFDGSGTTCSDGLAWFTLLLQVHGSVSQEAQIQLEHAVNGLQSKLDSHLGFVSNHWNATWMDTIGREGYRLEVQAGYAAALRLLGREREARRFERHVLNHFWQSGKLLDGFFPDGTPDTTPRLNGFLAYLIAPHLLSRAHWTRTFADALQACSLPWGGLASVATHHPSYHPDSDGARNGSYHQGDTWWFMHGLVLTALKRLGARNLAGYQKQLWQAAERECLEGQVPGYCGEISEAVTGESLGCGVQAFSAGALMLACREYGRD